MLKQNANWKNLSAKLIDVWKRSSSSANEIEKKSSTKNFILLKTWRLAIVFLFIVSTLFALLGGVRSFWTDSEMWPVVAAKHFFSISSSDYNFHVKPLYDLMLFANFNMAEALYIHPMWTARIFGALNAIFVICLVYGILRRLKVNSSTAFVATVLFVSNSFFIKRFTHVRSDLLISTILLGLTWVQLFEPWQKLTSLRRVGIFLGFAAIGVAITPKSILLFSIWALTFLGSDLKVAYRLRSSRALGVLLVLLGIVYGVWNWSVVLFFVSSFSYFDLPYFSWNRFAHVQKYFQENIICVILILYLIFCVLFKRNLDPAIRKLVNFCAGLVLLLALYPDRLPFFIASLTPFFYLAPIAIRPGILDLAFSKIWIRAILLVYAFANIWSWGLFTNYMHSSEPQEVASLWLAKEIGQTSNFKIYDPVGVLPFFATYNWFVGPGEAGSDDALNRILAKKPDIVIYTMRLQPIGDALLKYLNSNYRQDATGVYVARRFIDSNDWPVRCDGLLKNILSRWPNRFDTGVRGPFVEFHTVNGWQEPVLLSKDLLQSCETLALPAGTLEVALTPLRISVPEGVNFYELFRFDPNF